MITVYMVGLIYHHGCTTDAKRALVPDGTAFEPRHYASLFVEPDRVKSYDWWKGQKFSRELNFNDASQGTVVEFRIPTRAEITFPDDDNDGAKFIELDKGLPQLETADHPDFAIDLDYPETIAEVPIHGGTSQAFDFRRPDTVDPKVAVVQWTIANGSSDVTIQARSLHGNQELTLTNCKSGSGLEIVFSNTADLIKDSCSRDARKDSHYTLYDKLNKKRPKQNLKDPPPPHLPCLHFHHSYLKYLQDQGRFPDVGCTPTCC